MYLEVRDVRDPWCDDVVRSDGTARAICCAWRDANPITSRRNNVHADGILVLNSKVEVTGSGGTYGKRIRPVRVIQGRLGTD